MLDRLVELLYRAHHNASCVLNEGCSEDDAIEEEARYLIANGVLVPPCNVNDTIYRCGDPIKKVYDWQIEHIEIYGDEVVFVDDSDNTFTEDDIGKTVFLTKEEAERALKGGDE
ncbi:MAG: hypothetical protein J6S14_11660 [Clostridia bacterium]|nr:hypothetical protein [Clostridia bacterium]